MPLLPGTVGLAVLLFWADQTVNALMPNATLVLAWTEGTAVRPLSSLGVPHYRRKRHISARDMSALLDYHNHIRASVHPPAANMEYMVSPRALPSPLPANHLSQPVLEGLDHSPAWPHKTISGWLDLVERAGFSLPILKMRSQGQRTAMYGAPALSQALHLTLRTLFLQGGNRHLHFPNKEIEMKRVNLPKVTQLGFQPRPACLLLKAVVLTNTIPCPRILAPRWEPAGGGWLGLSMLVLLPQGCDRHTCGGSWSCGDWYLRVSS